MYGIKVERQRNLVWHQADEGGHTRLRVMTWAGSMPNPFTPAEDIHAQARDAIHGFAVMTYSRFAADYMPSRLTSAWIEKSLF